MYTNRFTLRSVQWSDVEAVADVMRDVLAADGDEMSAVTPEELTNEWKAEGFDIATDAWVVTDESGRVVGYEECVQRHEYAYFNGDGYVHPDFRGNGIGSALLHKVTERVGEMTRLAKPDLRVYIRNGMSAADQLPRGGLPP